MRRFVQVFVIAVLAVAGVGAAAIFSSSGSSASAAVTPTTKVTVTMTEFKFKLSKSKVPLGTVIFTVVNKGKVAHDFKINGKKTPRIAPGKSAKLTVKFTKSGNLAYLCTLPGHAAAGMKGKLAIGKAVVAAADHADDHRSRGAPGRPGRGRSGVRSERMRRVSHPGRRRRDRHRRPEPRPAEADAGHRAHVRPERLHGRRRHDAGVHEPEPDGREQHRGVRLPVDAPLTFAGGVRRVHASHPTETS